MSRFAGSAKACDGSVFFRRIGRLVVALTSAILNLLLRIIRGKIEAEVAGVKVGVGIVRDRFCHAGSGRGRPLDSRRDAGATVRGLLQLLEISPGQHGASVFDYVAKACERSDGSRGQQLPPYRFV